MAICAQVAKSVGTAGSQDQFTKFKVTIANHLIVQF